MRSSWSRTRLFAILLSGCFGAVVQPIPSVRGDFVDVSVANGFAWDRPTTVGGLATFQAWEVFSSTAGPNSPNSGILATPSTVFGAGSGATNVFTSGAANAGKGFGGPDGTAWITINTGGTPNAFDSASATSGSFLTSGGNIYSPTGINQPRIVIPNNIDGITGNQLDGTTSLVLQVRTLGSAPSLGSFLLTDPVSGTQLAPSSSTVLFSAINTGFGGVNQDLLLNFQAPGNADLYTFDFAASSSSMSLDRISVDTFFSPTAVPEPTSLALMGVASLFAFRRRNRVARGLAAEVVTAIPKAVRATCSKLGIMMVAIMAMSSVGRADFALPDAHGWSRPTVSNFVSGVSGSTFQAWDVFSTPGGPNAPASGILATPTTVFGAGTGATSTVTLGASNVGRGFGGTAGTPWSNVNEGGTANAFNTGSSSFVTSGGNIYSPSGVVTPRVVIPNNVDGVMGNQLTGSTSILFQTRTQGTAPSLSSFLLTDPVSGQQVSPTSSQLLATQLLGGFGGTLYDYLFKFDVLGNADSYQIDFSAAGSSMSLDRIAVDTNFSITAVPEPTSIGGAFVLGGLGMLYRRRRPLGRNE